MTSAVAKAMAESRFWEKLSHVEIAWFQLNEEKLCMPFHRFQNAMEKSLNRPVWTHEFAYRDMLIGEFIEKHGDLG
jgi:hypothetical protein